MNPFILPLITEFLPTLGRWLAHDKATDVVGHVETLAKNITGLHDMKDAITVLRQQPEVLLAFQKAWVQYEETLTRLSNEDRNNARYRDINLYGQKRRWRADMMTTVAVFGLAGCLGMLIYSPALPREVMGIISTIAGIFGSCLKDVYAFEFGSSRSSQEKTALLSR